MEKMKDSVDRMRAKELKERLYKIHPVLAEEFPGDSNTMKSIYRSLVEHGKSKIGELKASEGVHDLDEIIREDLKKNKIKFKEIPEFYKERIWNAVRNYERKTQNRALKNY